MKTRFLAFFLAALLLFSVFSATILAAGTDEGTTETTSTTKNETRLLIEETFGEYHVNNVELDTDGYIGIPVGFDVYVRDTATLSNKSAVAFYVINTNTERVGTDSDVSIIADMLKIDTTLTAEENRATAEDDAMIVVVVDYYESEKATTPDLDWSLQRFHQMNNDNGTYLHDTRDGGDVALPYGEDRLFILPAGYNVLRDVEFFNFLEHGTDGLEDWIVNVWNEDFRSRKGSSKITWGQKTLEDGTLLYTDAEGNRCTSTDTGYAYLDGSAVDATATTVSPLYKTVSDSVVWIDEAARITSVKYTVAEDYWDCVKSNGDQMDYSLRLDLMYPTNPEGEVPVMVLHSSSSNRLGNWVSRPHMTGYLFNGYAGSVFDHAYIPMSRGDHYGYFDGLQNKSAFTLMYYTGNKSATAAIRCLRSLADSDTYQLDREHFGVYGHSKGAYIYFLGDPDCENAPEQVFFAGHTGESSKEQPFLTYQDGTKIPSNVQMVYMSSGSGLQYVSPNHAPTFTSAGEDDVGAFTQIYNNIINNCRYYDIPSMNFSMPGVGHTMIYGYSEKYDVDMYQALFDFSNYHLKGSNAICEYILPLTETTAVPTDQIFTLKFSGPISKAEIESSVVMENLYTGKAVSGTWESSFGNTTWEFIPDYLDGGTVYRLTVPKTMLAENGESLAASKSIVIRTAYEFPESAITMESADGSLTATLTDEGENGVFVEFEGAEYSISPMTSLRFTVTNDAYNHVDIYAISEIAENLTDSVLGEKLGTVAVYGKGEYTLDISEYLRSIADGESVAFCFKTALTVGESTVTYLDYESNSSAVEITVNGVTTKALKKTTSYNDKTIIFPDGFIGEDDLGKRYRISFDIYSTVQRTVQAYVSDKTEATDRYVDYNNTAYAIKELVPGEWNHFEYVYEVNDPAYTSSAIQKCGFYVRIFGDTYGLNSVSADSFYLDNVTVVEEITPVTFGGVGTDGAAQLVLHNANCDDAAPILAEYVQSGSYAEVDIDEDGNLYVAGATKTLLASASRKAYAKLSLENYKEGRPAKINVKVTDATDLALKLSVYGISDPTLASDWSAENIQYMNAPANDRYGIGVDLSKVYGGGAFSVITVDGAGVYQIDVTEYAAYMHEAGATVGTLIFVLDTGAGVTVDTQSINGASGYKFPDDYYGYSTSGVTPTRGYTTNENYPAPAASSYSFYFQPPTVNGRIYFKMFTGNIGALTADDIGRSFTYSFYFKTDMEKDIYLELGKSTSSIVKTETVHYKTPNTWQQMSISFTVDASMIGTLCLYVRAAELYVADEEQEVSATVDYMYFDQMTLVENSDTRISFTPLGVTEEEERTPWVKTLDFESTWKYNAGSPAVSEVNDKYDSSYSGGSDIKGYPVTLSDEVGAHSGTKALQFIVTTSAAKRLRLYNLFEANLTEDDIGREFTITWYMRANKANASFQVGFMPSQTTTLSSAATKKVVAQDTWEQFSYTFTVTSAMVLAEGAAVGSNPACFTFKASTTSVTFYIDDLTITENIPEPEVDPDEEAILNEVIDDTLTPYVYENTFDQNAGGAVVLSGFESASSKLATTPVYDFTANGGRSVRVTHDKSYNRICLYYALSDSQTHTVLDSDVGRRYRMSFYMMAQRPGSFTAALGVTGGTTYSKTVSYKITEASVWQKIVYEVEITSSMVGKSLVLLIKPNFDVQNGANPCYLYFDNYSSREFIPEASESLPLSETASIMGGDKTLAGELLVTRGMGSTSNEGIRKTYLAFTGKDVDVDRIGRSYLTVDVTAALGQQLTLWGLSADSLGAGLTYDNAPANEAGTKMNLSGASAITTFVAKTGTLRLDVTDYVKSRAGKDCYFVLTTDTDGGQVMAEYDFSTVSVTGDIDYETDATVTVADGALSSTAGTVKFYNMFGAASAPIVAGRTYTVSATVSTDAETSVTLAIVGTAGQVTVKGGGQLSFTYVASEEDASSGASMVSLSADGAFVLTSISVVRNDDVAIDVQSVMLETHIIKQHDGPALSLNVELHTSIDLNAYVPAVDGLTAINGSAVEEYETVDVNGAPHYKVPYASTLPNDAYRAKTLILTIMKGSRAVDVMREISLEKYARVILGDAKYEKEHALMLSALDYMNETARYFDQDLPEGLSELLLEQGYERPAWKAEDGVIHEIPSEYQDICGIAFQLDTYPAMVILVNTTYEGEVKVGGTTYDAKTLNTREFVMTDGQTVTAKYIVYQMTAFTLSNTVSICTDSDVLSYNLHTYIYRLQSDSREYPLAEAIAVYTKEACNYIISHK